MSEQVLHATINTIAESLGISHVKGAVFSELTNRSQRFIFNILADGVQIMRTSKRKILRITDINAALEREYMEPLYGYDSKSVPKLVKAGTENALDLLLYEDSQVPVDSFSKFDILPYPLDISFELEWLAVVGKPTQKEELIETSEQKELQLIQPGVQRQRADADLDFAPSKLVLSYELQLFYKTIRMRLLSNNPAQREHMFKYLAKESCIQSLIPCFVRLSQQSLTQNHHDYNSIYTSIGIVEALISNTNDLKFFEVYINHFLSIILSVMLSTAIGSKSLSLNNRLREYASRVLAALMDRVYLYYPSLQPRLTSQLLSFIINNRSLKERYGAIAGLMAFGNFTISKYLLPEIPNLIASLNTEDENDPEKRTMAMMIYQMALKSAGNCLHGDTFRMTALGFLPLTSLTYVNYREIMDTFGTDLSPYCVDESAFLYL